MLPIEKERDLIDRFLPIEDVQERLALIVDRARRLPPLVDSERCDANRVQGCSSRVWIAASLDANDVCHFRLDADSTLVKGLAGLICEIYDGAPVHEVAAVEPTVLEALHLIDQLSPTRRNGLDQVRRAIRDFAMRTATVGTAAS